MDVPLHVGMMVLMIISPGILKSVTAANDTIIAIATVATLQHFLLSTSRGFRKPNQFVGKANRLLCMAQGPRMMCM